MKKIDIIVYGATGFTGNLCVKYLKKTGSAFSWGIAGRNREKLLSLTKSLSIDCKIFIADGDDNIALDKITDIA